MLRSHDDGECHHEHRPRCPPAPAHEQVDHTADLQRADLLPSGKATAGETPCPGKSGVSVFSPKKLRARRNELKLNAEDVADRLGISQPAYSRHEAPDGSKPKVKRLLELAEAVELKVCYLLTDGPLTLEHYRVTQGWTIGQTAIQLGLKRSERYGQIEAGEVRPDQETMLLMSRKFETPLADIEAAAKATAEARARAGVEESKSSPDP